MKDRFGNDFEPLTPARLTGERCVVTTCPSNTGVNCELSRYDHPDAIHPDKCHHRRFILKVGGRRY